MALCVRYRKPCYNHFYYDHNLNNDHNINHYVHDNDLVHMGSLKKLPFWDEGMPLPPGAFSLLRIVV